MPREEETFRSVGPFPVGPDPANPQPELWPADADERIRLAREATLAARAPYIAAEEARRTDP